MTAQDKNSISISKTNSGFPDYLDFEKLRRESIEYISQLSGKIWTDHNVHDPGITILESLCYALIDLGYRTHLPIEDLLAPHPDEAGEDTNFFTAAEILTCNPLTIIDYRKLLVDIEGVRNAWLFPADEKDTCRPTSSTDANSDEQFLNGIYRVQIELENYPDADSPQSVSEFAKPILEKVKLALMSHRNFCEDFLDIHVLCRFEIGVCASIELEDQADPEIVYVDMIHALNEFFSPAPRFYTLQQMLERKISIDEIYSGRPYDKTNSHGFVDTVELEALELRKEIHVSDVYTALFKVKGIKKITALRLINCAKNAASLGNWKVSIPKDHVPAFTVPCSGFEFIRNGLKVAIDTQKFETLFEIGLNNNNKTAYPYSSSYLDPELKQGSYQEALSDYYSIQNEFPQVYGIGNGHLPESAPALRKAQALQLKGYLLFFDQLLANYLSQLQHIRSYFSLSAPKDKAGRHTYFSNQLTTVPELDKLLRFSKGNSTRLGKDGATLAFPISISHWENLKSVNSNLQDQIASLPSYEFVSMGEATDAILVLQNDLIAATNTHVLTFKTADDTWCYSIAATDTDYVVLCKQLFETEQAAKQHASSLQYTAIHQDNYRHFITQHNKFSFEIEFNITSYTGYLERLAEDETLYRKRRKDFLNHLLARFSEKFTEFALLKWQDEQSIPVVERFLTDYDDLSRNRGRAYNYQSQTWSSENQSGFEKKVKALAGLSPNDTTLSHFVVEPCEEHFTISIRNEKAVLFDSKQRFDSREEAELAILDLIKAMADPNAYHTHYLAHEKSYQLQLHYGYATPALHPELFKNSQHTEQLAHHILSCANPNPDKTQVVVSHYIWRSELRNSKNERMATSVHTYDSREKAKSDGLRSIKKLSDPKIWEASTSNAIPALQSEKTGDNDPILVDFSAFKTDINDTIIGKPGRYTYDLLDQKNTFKLRPKNTFDSSRTAGEHARSMLITAADLHNWQIEQDSKKNQFSIHLCRKGIPEASFTTDTKTYAETEELLTTIYQLIKEHFYHLTEAEHPNQWKFNYTLGYEQDAIYKFESDQEFDSEKNAQSALSDFYKGIAGLTLKNGSGPSITLASKIAKYSVSVTTDDKQAIDSRKKIGELLQDQKEVFQIFENASKKDLNNYVHINRKSEHPTFLYRLVNNNHIPARSRSSISNAANPQLYKRKLAAAYKQQNWFPAICQGGDILTKHTDVNGNTRFHYEIRFRHLPFSGCEETPMLTSAFGYETEKEAEDAFRETYIRILDIASDEAAYNKRILLSPVYLSMDATTPLTDVLAFIPEETIQIFQKNFPKNWLETFIRLLSFYPVKCIKKNSKRFVELFCVKEEIQETSVSDWVYYFDYSLLQPPTGLADVKWVSTAYFQTPDEALQEFIYFNHLLSYTGNWYIDTGYCNHTKTTGDHFFIREVLAESSICYPSEEEAWGVHGVEAFICAIQSQNGIRNYIRRADCSYSFYVSCGENAVVHPCTYDTTPRRDEAMNELYSRFKRLAETKAYALTYEETNLILHNKEGVAVARLRDTKNTSVCDAGITLVETIQSPESTWETVQGIYTLQNSNKQITLESIEKATIPSLENWKVMLAEWACFFPIVKTESGSKVITDATGKKVSVKRYTYCVEIKLPGFGDCGRDKLPDSPCDCKTKKPVAGLCHVAWKSNCCFDTCEEAFRTLELTLNQLIDFRNYYAVFDCHAHSFGIAIHNDTKGIRDTGVTGTIIARNPQYYQTPDQVCKATGDAKKLVNAAGLHVVEHILLRPHCEEDCACEQRSQNCDHHANCSFPPYLISHEDPCVKDETLTFIPGLDPYSFIATVMLPAWPALFHDKDKKQQVEHILYSEAPAHVLLRILWLRPKDFYVFEKQFKIWKKWLAGLALSERDFSVCNFLHIVTKESYSCLPECTTCQPCKKNIAQKETPCTANRSAQEGRPNKEEHDFLNQVNEILCMGTYRCGTIDEKKDSDKTKKRQPDSDSKVKAQFINSRHSHYVQTVNTISTRTNENPIAKKTAAFIQNNHPGIEQLEQLVKELIQNKKPDQKSGKILTKQQLDQLVSAAIHHYLDKIAFNGKEAVKITALAPIIGQLKKVKLDLQKLYQTWEPHQVSTYEPDLDTLAIKKIMTGK